MFTLQLQLTISAAVTLLQVCVLPTAVSLRFVHTCRQEHQGFRGGGAICFVDNSAMWLSWSSLIHGTKNCTQETAVQ